VKALTEAILRLRLAPPGERYQRVALCGDALHFAVTLRDTCGVSTRVYRGASDSRKPSSTFGYIVALADDRAAALAGHAGRVVATMKADG
jgi:hypothetical protein